MYRSICLVLFLCAAHAFSLTSFISTNNDFQYTAPSGWYFLQNDIEDETGFSSISVRWDANPRPVIFFIIARSYPDSNQALIDAYHNEFKSFHEFRKQSFPVAPAILSTMDTTISVVHYFGSELKKDSVQVSYAAVYKSTRLWFMYVTTNQDYQANRTEYYKSFQGMSFKSLSTGVLRKSNQAVDMDYEKKIIFDLLGRQLQSKKALNNFQVSPLVK